MIPVQHLHWLPSLLPATGPLTRLVEEFRKEPPSNASEIVLHSVFQKKSDMSWLERRRRRLNDLMRPLSGQRRELQPLIQKDSGKLYLFFTGENTRIRMNLTDYALGFSYEDEVNHPNYRRLPLYAIDGNLQGLTQETRAALLESAPAKTEFCEFVYSHDVKQRNALHDLIARYQKVTCPGKCLNNAPSIDASLGLSPAESRQQDNWFDARLPYCQKFKFSIACENERSPGYATEKILTAFRAGTIPIYFGDPRIAEQFNPASFLDASQLSEEELLQRVEELDRSPEAYQAMLQEAPITKPETEAYFSKVPFLER